MFSSKGFSIALMFGFFVHFELIFYIYYRERVQFYSYTSIYLAFLALFVSKIAFSSLDEELAILMKII